MKKKIISTLLCTAMLATMVAGCGVEKSDGGSDTEGSASSVAEMKGTGDNEINILIYAQDHEKAVYQELINCGHFGTVCHTQHIYSCYTCKCGDAVCTAVFGKDGYSSAKLKII